MSIDLRAQFDYSPAQLQDLPMKASDLVTVWSAPDNSRLTTKQYSFRLPVHVAAKLAALEELYPTRSRTQLVGDLLTAAIAEVEKNLESHAGAPLGHRHPETGEEMYTEEGQIADYRRAANRHYETIETELGNEKPGILFSGNYATTADSK
jgi:hypothetical protein